MFEQPKNHPVVSSAREGQCFSCGAKGVMVSAPPGGRCIDRRACDRQRSFNRMMHGRVERASKVRR